MELQFEKYLLKENDKQDLSKINENKKLKMQP